MMGSILQWLTELTSSRRWVYWTLAALIGISVVGVVNGGNEWLVESGEGEGVLSVVMPFLAFAYDAALNVLAPLCVMLFVVDAIMFAVEEQALKYKSSHAFGRFFQGIVCPADIREPSFMWYRRWLDDKAVFLAQISAIIMLAYTTMHPGELEQLIVASMNSPLVSIPMLLLLAFVIVDWAKTVFFEFPRYEYYQMHAKLEDKSS